MSSTLSRYGWDDRWEQLAHPYLDAGCVPGRIARVDRSRVDVLTDQGRRRADPGRRPPLAVGDWCSSTTALVTVALEAAARTGRVERLLALAWESGATPVVVLTKIDGSEYADGRRARGRRAPVSAVTGEGLARLAAERRSHAKTITKAQRAAYRERRR